MTIGIDQGCPGITIRGVLGLRSGVSWDYNRGGFWAATSNESDQFPAHLNSLQPRVRRHSYILLSILLSFSLEKGYA